MVAKRSDDKVKTSLNLDPALWTEVQKRCLDLHIKKGEGLSQAMSLWLENTKHLVKEQKTEPIRKRPAG